MRKSPFRWFDKHVLDAMQAHGDAFAEIPAGTVVNADGGLRDIDLQQNITERIDRAAC